MCLKDNNLTEEQKTALFNQWVFNTAKNHSLGGGLQLAPKQKCELIK